MVLNKCSMERGLAHGQIYKTEVVDLTLRESQAGKKLKLGEVSHLKVLDIFFHASLFICLTDMCVFLYTLL